MARFVRQITFTSGDERRLAVRPAHRQQLQEELIRQDPYTAAGVVKEVSLRRWIPILPA